MTPYNYLGWGVAVMLLKFALALVAAKRSADTKARLLKTWSAWSFLLGVAFWPVELAHLVYVLLGAFLRSMIEAA